mmetsp:Transcript_9212/g.13637  ORF Transcript_9212/g.13637 Transcript_9212/m.13637 type:complete len:428 (-) Transcript_9212:667-1950(-)
MTNKKPHDSNLIIACYKRVRKLHKTNIIFHTLQCYKLVSENSYYVESLLVLKEYIQARSKRSDSSDRYVKELSSLQKTISLSSRLQRRSMKENDEHPTSVNFDNYIDKVDHDRQSKDLVTSKTKELRQKIKKPPKSASIQCRYEQSGFCRSKNIRHHKHRCKYKHIYPVLPTEVTSFKKEALFPGHVEYDNLAIKFYKTMHHSHLPNLAFPSAKLVNIFKISNLYLKLKFEERKQYLLSKSKNTDERKLYHGTYSSMHRNVFKKGFIVPPDYEPNPRCPRSGKLSISICGASCSYCTQPHRRHGGCHMYGLGVYFFDRAAKSHHHVREPTIVKNNVCQFKMIVCSVLLGKPYVIDKDLAHEDQMHDKILAPYGHDSIFVPGRKDSSADLGVRRSEFVIFHPFQALPTHEIIYEIPLHLCGPHHKPVS